VIAVDGYAVAAVNHLGMTVDNTSLLCCNLCYRYYITRESDLR